MTVWITSDTHWGHKNIMTFCPESRARFNNDVAFMNEAMVQEWNAMVQPDDLVYILGDVAFLSPEKATIIMRKLNGSKILIEGNHDSKNLKDANFRACFNEVHQYLKLKYEGHVCILSHYPIAHWDEMHRGSLHFHGHLHGNVSGLEKFRAMDVGMDATGQIVIELSEAINRIKDNAIRQHHQKGDL